MATAIAYHVWESLEQLWLTTQKRACQTWGWIFFFFDRQSLTLEGNIISPDDKLSAEMYICLYTNLHVS